MKQSTLSAESLDPLLGGDSGQPLDPNNQTPWLSLSIEALVAKYNITPDNVDNIINGWQDALPLDRRSEVIGVSRKLIPYIVSS
jgi:hypothetical protein